MPKRPLPVLTLVSAILCVGSLLLVGRSFIRMDVVSIPFGQNNVCGASSSHGRLILWRLSNAGKRSYFSVYAVEGRFDFNQDVRGIRWLGIGWGVPHGFQALILPLWLVPLLTAILPVRWWRARRRDGARGFEMEPAATA